MGNTLAKCLFLVFPLLLSAGPAPATQPDLARQCESLAAEWKARFEAERFAVLIAPPFVIAGDGGAAKLERYRDGTILAAERALQAMYFQKRPEKPILILLFESEAPYRRLARQWFNDPDVPHFGFFRSDNIMLMNMATGTGTLVHEIVHALIRPDFPQVPGWFNEGLASLYEQSSIDGDSIRGLVNWRLPALKRAIEQGRLRPLREMIEDPNFYREDLVGLNYAQARYLMMYLQEQGLLQQFYAGFRSGHAEDPTGIKALEKVIDPLTLGSLEKRWRDWVLALK